MENPLKAAAATTSPVGTSIVRSEKTGSGPVASPDIEPEPIQAITSPLHHFTTSPLHSVLASVLSTSAS